MPPPPPPAADLPPPPAEHSADPDDDDDLEDDDIDDDMDVYDDEDDAPHPASSAAAAPPPEDPNSSPSSSTDDDDGLHPNGQQPPPPVASLSLIAVTPESRPSHEERRPFSSIEERRLFQRLWTDEDEIAILQGFYEFTSRRGTTHHAHQHDTGPFYEEIRNRLRLDFTKNQLVEKIRRLKKKYRNVVTRMSSGRDFAFKSPHEKATYEIARMIWSANVSKKGFDQDDDDLNDVGDSQPLLLDHKDNHRRRGIKRSLGGVVAVVAASEAVPVEVKSVPAIPLSVNPPPQSSVAQMPAAGVAPPVLVQNSGSSSVVEETVKNCFSPLVKDLVQYVVNGALGNGVPGGSLMGLGALPLGFTGNSASLGLKDAALDGRWRKQQILELEVYSKRLELVLELIKVKLEELRSLG